VEVNGNVRHAERIRIFPGERHRVTGPLQYLEISTYAPDDVVRLEDDYGRAT